MTFTLPAEVAAQGVYAAIFGLDSSSSWVYLAAGADAPPTTSTLSTTTLGGVAPTATVIAVGSVAGFPASGSLLLIQPGLVVEVSYTSVDGTSNTFEGVVFPPMAPGVGPNTTVASVNVLAATLTVASTTGFSSSGWLLLQSPAGATPCQNVAVQYTGISGNTFTGVTGYAAEAALPSGGAVVQLLAPQAAPGYVSPTYGQNLPLIVLSPVGESGPVDVTVNLPDPASNPITSGVMVIAVGSPIALPVAGSTVAPTVGSPTPMTNPNDVFGLLEWGLGSGLDFDVSEVDQVGFPFQVTTTNGGLPPPADPKLGVGMLLGRTSLFAGFKTFIQGLPAASGATVFLQGAADNTDAPFPVNTRLTAPQDIVDIFLAVPPLIADVAPSGKTTTGPSVMAYYVVTATSAAGESMGSIAQSGATGDQTSLTISWNAYPYAESYNIYWSASPDMSGAQRIQSGVPASTLSFIDTSPGIHSGSAATPPTNNYSYSPLNAYFTPALTDFFSYFENNPFVFDDPSTNTKWVGTVSTVNGYSVLTLTGGQGQFGNTFAGETLAIYSPIFSSNTDQPLVPAAPVWLTAVSSGFESPSSMIFGADGIFGNVTGPNSSLPVGEAKNLYNSIVSAFNRGLTPRSSGGAWVNLLPPTYWASAPLLTGVAPIADGSLAAGTYNYVVTALNVNLMSGTVEDVSGSSPVTITTSNPHGLAPGDTVEFAGLTGTFTVTVTGASAFTIPVSSSDGPATGGTWTQVQTPPIETTPSNSLPVTTSATGGVTVQWSPINPTSQGPNALGAETAAAFNVYRSTWSGTAWGPYQRLNSVPIANDGSAPVTSYTDDGSAPTSETPPFVYYAPGQLANFYAAYFSQLDVSINGLGYGFPYADKGGQSTNVQIPTANATGLQVTLLPWNT